MPTLRTAANGGLGGAGGAAGASSSNFGTGGALQHRSKGRRLLGLHTDLSNPKQPEDQHRVLKKALGENGYLGPVAGHFASIYLRLPQTKPGSQDRINVPLFPLHKYWSGRTNNHRNEGSRHACRE